MLARLSLALICTATLSAPALAKDKSPAQEIACEGVFGPLSSEALLKETFGAENVVTGNVPGPEGIEYLATTVFGDDPERRMEFGWYDEENLQNLSYMTLSRSQKGPEGIQVGMSVAEVEAINGAPFNVGGFWWDYGGYGMIESGKLLPKEDGCYVSLRFSPSEDSPQDIDVTPVSGEVTIPSSEPLLETLDVRVQEVTISYPNPEGEAGMLED